MPNVAGFGASGRAVLQTVALVLMAGAVLAAVPGNAEAKGRGRSIGKTARSSSGPSGPASGKIAVFTFDGDDFTKVRKHVLTVLTNQGLQVDTTIKPVQTAEEFRDMGAMLNLAAYVHGRIKELPADKAEATITVRSGVTGRTLTTATFVGYRGGIRFDVEEKLWARIGKSLKQVCKEATKPRRPVNAPMRIEAGTPL